LKPNKKKRFPEISIYVASKDGATDKSLLQNKLVITTIHQSKVETKGCYIIYLDKSYEFYKKE
jgi:hypothetical protein